VVVKVNLYLLGGAYELDQSGVVLANGTIQVNQTVTRKYYTFGGATIAMKEGTTLKYFLTDHLGSTAAVLGDSGNLLSQQPWAFAHLCLRHAAGRTGDTCLLVGYGISAYIIYWLHQQ
jgi:hypothetical protein